MIVITSFEPSSDRHLPQLPSSVRHLFSSPVGRLVCGLVFGLRARPSVGRLVCGQVMSMIRSATHLTRATWILPMRAYFVRAKTVLWNFALAGSVFVVEGSRFLFDFFFAADQNLRIVTPE